MASLTLRNGPLGKRLAAHLLRRATYNITPARIDTFATMTAAQAVDALFVIPPYVHPEGPLNWEDGGTAWLTTGPYLSRPSSGGQRKRAVRFWFYNELIRDTSIRHKMTMFFHSIFISAIDTDWRLFDNWRLFQYYALGNIKTLTQKITTDNLMLRYLNNDVNKKSSPNENYSREFLELFTILKGEQVGVGDYSTYTEHDIVQAARVFSGFTTDGFEDKDPVTGLAIGRANYNNHDAGNKTFSHAFQNHTIHGAVDEADMFRELEDFVEMVYSKDATARSFCRRLYLFFVSDIITEEIENDIIAPMAVQLKNDNYEVINTLKLLLKSVHFYDEDDSDATNEIIGGKIKSGLHLYMTSLNLFNANGIPDLNADFALYPTISNYLINRVLLPMGFPNHPASVEGYPGFFKSPGFSNFWFDQTNIGHRYRLGYSLINGKSLLNNTTIPFKINLIQFFTQNFTNQKYSNQLVLQFLEYTLPEMPDAARIAYFENFLLGGLSPINWFFEWHAYEQSGDGTAVEIALGNFFDAVVNSPEFQTF